MKRIYFCHYGIDRRYMSEPCQTLNEAIAEAKKHDFIECTIKSMNMSANYPENTIRTEQVYDNRGKLAWENKKKPIWD